MKPYAALAVIFAMTAPALALAATITLLPGGDAPILHKVTNTAAPCALGHCDIR